MTDLIIFLIFYILIMLYFLVKPYGWVNIIFGIFGLAIGSLTIGNSIDYPFQPYLSLFILISSCLTMYSGAESLRHS